MQFHAWVQAYGGISWENYMKKLLTLDQTGSWVKDVINLELKESKKVNLTLGETKKTKQKIPCPELDLTTL
jgi:hypothetical protein